MKKTTEKKAPEKPKENNFAPYTMSIPQVFSLLQTGKDGLTDQEAKKRLNKYGKNELEKTKKNSKLKMFFKQFCDLMIIILLIAGIVSAVVAIVEKNYADLIDVAIILLIVLLNAIIGFVQEDKAETSLEKLKKSSEPYVKVIRGGVVCKVLTTEVVVGDIVMLEAGDIACADMLLIESASLKCDESSLTGETTEIIKIADEKLAKETLIADRTNMVHSNSVITYGRGLGVVVATGMNTEIGKIAGLLNKSEDEKTPLQEKLGWLGKFITVCVLVVAVVIFIINICTDPNHDFVKPLMIAIAIAVAAIPESLPAVITIIMALGVSRMSKKNAIIRKLHAVETLGSCEVICSDKTGTLTQNKMQVQGIWLNGKILHSIADAVENKHFMNCLQLCNDCAIKKDAVLGDPTEVALVEYCMEFSFNKINAEKQFPRVAELPFDSNRKLMTTFNKVGKEVIAYTKGAHDVLLSRCSRILIDGKVKKLTDEIKQDILKAVNKMAGKGWRVLAMSYKEKKNEKYTFDDEQDMIFLGFVGMQDPPRESTYKAVKVCRNAGMIPVMITGDHAITAKQIAKEVGIWTKDSMILTGKELDRMTDKQFLKIIDKVSVYARVSPENKVRIVETWQKLGKVVAMTGDGVNDAPSIKRADIGVGMGITGTEVTKNVADMVLTDDNFATIIVAVKEGRKIYQNIQKVIQFLFGTNFVEVMSLLIATIAFPHLSFLLPLQILFINLISDSLPAIALSVEESEKDIMDRKPRKKKENIFAGGIWQSMVVQIITQTIIVVGTFAITMNLTGDNTLATTMAFSVLSVSQLFHIFNVRTSHSIFRSNPFKNYLIWVAFLVGLALNILVISIPAVAGVFGLTPLNVNQWLIVLGLSLIIIPVMEIYKAILYAVKKRKEKNKKS